MLTEEQKAGLSEGEIAAIEGEEDEDTSADESTDEEGSDDEGTDEEADDESTDSTDDDAAADGDDDQEDAQEDVSPDMSDAPFVNPGAIRYTDAVRPDIKEQLDTLRSEYEAGDKELAEYEAAKRKLDADNMNWQAGTQLWDAEQAAFLAKFTDFSNPGPLRGALESEISRIDRATGNSLSGMQLLMAAKESVEQAMNVKVAAVKDVKPEAKDTKRPKAKRPKADVHAVEHAAPAGEQGIGGDFAHMENMNGLELESAVAKMTDEQRDRWYRQG